MKRAVLFLPAVFMLVCIDTAYALDFTVVPFEFDPPGSYLVASIWKSGTGCPSSGVVPAAATRNPPPFSDPGCPSTDIRDSRVEGLVLAKTGPSATNASAGATLVGVRGITLSELGYDLRKPGGVVTDPRGSHCGSKAPRFSIVTQDNVKHSLGCTALPVTAAASNNWIRLRFSPANATPTPISPTATVKNIQIIFDEGQDIGPDNFGLAVLDNIDVNGTLVGRSPTRREEWDEDSCGGGDANHDFQCRGSASRPETSAVSYRDWTSNVKLQSLNGAQSITYAGACVTFVTDAFFNDDPGYAMSFTACDLSTGIIPQIGTWTVLVTNALGGTVYENTGTMTAGVVSIHPQ